MASDTGNVLTGLSIFGDDTLGCADGPTRRRLSDEKDRKGVANSAFKHDGTLLRAAFHSHLT